MSALAQCFSVVVRDGKELQLLDWDEWTFGFTNATSTLLSKYFFLVYLFSPELPRFFYRIPPSYRQFTFLSKCTTFLIQNPQLTLSHSHINTPLRPVKCNALGPMELLTTHYSIQKSRLGRSLDPWNFRGNCSKNRYFKTALFNRTPSYSKNKVSLLSTEAQLSKNVTFLSRFLLSCKKLHLSLQNFTFFYRIPT